MLVAPTDLLERLDRGVARMLSADGGYLTERFRGTEVASDTSRSAFVAFTEHTANGRWPADHQDPTARNQPKDGAVLLDDAGGAWRCEAKLRGLPNRMVWPNHGTRHQTALEVLSFLDRALAFVRSDGAASTCSAQRLLLGAARADAAE